ncbi:DUF736 family protein [Shinella zoogloeoides]|uniref:DUF736 family protein n=1 Tax=Shinella zoogloeoides TaxID=352475 RepID=UPI000E6467CB|nr:DUF736 family protein [Shinella zoogloeoides]
MNTHLIAMLLPGPLGIDVDLSFLLDLPIALHPIERTNHYAPDYRLDTSDVELGHGWSNTSPVNGIPYIAVVVRCPSGKRISGVAWQSPEQAGLWAIQLQESCTVDFHA